jgi:hypothetical protein
LILILPPLFFSTFSAKRKQPKPCGWSIGFTMAMRKFRSLISAAYPPWAAHSMAERMTTGANSRFA